jgi:hypothetical protein
MDSINSGSLRFSLLPVSLLVMFSAFITSLVIFKGITLNQSFAVIISLIVLTTWIYNRSSGVVLALIFFFTKPFFLRIAYGIDYRLTGAAGFDLLGIAPALLLAGLILSGLYSRLTQGERICPDTTRTLMIIFAGLGFLSIFFPTNSVLVGFGGFERNILPNMMILFLTASVFSGGSDAVKILKAMLILGVVSCLYGLGQHILGYYPWEKDWLSGVAFNESSEGWLTIGERGIELRVFSLFYGYMDFTFTNALIFSLVLACNRVFRGGWVKIRTGYFILWSAMLLLTLERMPIMMSLVSLAIVYYLRSSQNRKRLVVWIAAAAVIILAALTAARPFLINTGIPKFIRLAELANPLKASSIGERAEHIWVPTLALIRSNPIGVGIGYGSQTKSSDLAAKSDLYVKPHNELLQKALETGIISGVVYLFLLISVFRDAHRLHTANGFARLFGFGMIAGTLGFWLCGLVNLPFSGSSGLIYWAMAGVALGLKERFITSDAKNYKVSSA